MKIPYKIIKSTGTLLFEFDENYEVLTDFFITDVSHIAECKRYLEYIKKATENNIVNEVTGNTITVSITRQTTKIQSNYYNISCEIETEEFKEIIENFEKELKIMKRT